MFLVILATLIIILRINELFVSDTNNIEIIYINSTDSNFVYITTCVNQTKLSTIIYKELPPLQDALDSFDWNAVNIAFEEQRKIHPSGNVYLPTDLYESYLSILVPYLEQLVCCNSST
jgi:hypothetical protein